MPITIEIQAQTRGSPITIHTQDQQEIQVPEGNTEIKIITNYRSGEVTPMFRVAGIVQGLYQLITVSGMWVNGQELRDHHRFMRQQISHNRYQQDRLITGEKEIAFNGEVALDTLWQQRWEWTTWYRSRSRWDWTYDNRRADCGTDLAGCYDICADPETSTHLDHLRQWSNRPHDTWATDGTYDHGCFGCSVTQGTALRQGDQWSNLLPGRNINLAQWGMGVDAMWMNLERAISKFQMSRIILLLPSWHRRLERVHRHGETLRWPLNVSSAALTLDDLPSAWWPREEQEAVRDRALARLVKHDHRRRGLRILDRVRRLLEAWGGEYWISSWSTEVHQDLSHAQIFDSQHLLPVFQVDQGALDGSHPSHEAHLRWVQEITPRIA